MNISITGLHLESDPKTKEYADKKTKKLLKYHPKIESISVRLLSEKNHRSENHDYYCELTVHIPGKVLEIVDTQRTILAAIDKAVDRMKTALVRAHEKQISKDHKRGVLRKFLSRFGR
ncbi:ribosome-associated translation inhibitor RaiA [Candidatus Curtissbacteria bacterium]|nr:ribosome-associated translation inhibitor RaiA [Candidatus Curtissbacteria bacterium]